MAQADSLAELLAALLRPGALIEAAVLAACLGLAWLLSWAGRRGRPASGAGGIWFGRHGVDGVVLPLLALGFALAARWLLKGHVTVAVFRIAIPVLLSLALIRIAVRVLRAAFPESAVVRRLERTFSWLVWIGVALWLTNVLPLMLQELEDIHWHVGGANVSVRSLIEGALTAAAVLVAMLWLSSAIEARLLAAAGVNLSLRKIAANSTRALLLLIGLLLAASAAGIPLGALSVVGGAVGVGIGLGLQRLAANYVSGFVILAERSLRIGDVVKVDGFEGRITDIKSRYTVIRAVTGRESVVPNEMLMTQRVESSSFADPKVALTTVVQVAYGTDLRALLPRLAEAVRGVPRVLPEPAPSIQLSAFAADGLELTVVFWIADPENGQGSVRSDVNLAILALLDASGVEIPFPQRVVHGR